MAPSETPPTAARRLFDHPSVRANYADMTAASSFVSQMANGTLPRAKYVAFLSQDRYFLFHFNRAYASALARAPGIEQQRTFHALIGGVLDELKLHEDACARWGVDDGALETIHPASRAYVDFLTALQSPDVPMDELVAGMTPCMVAHSSQIAGKIQKSTTACWDILQVYKRVHKHVHARRIRIGMLGHPAGL